MENKVIASTPNLRSSTRAWGFNDVHFESKQVGEKSTADAQYPEGFGDFLKFLCERYGVDRQRVFIEYSSNPPPPLRGNRLGYYDGLLSHREKDGHLEFLITVYRIAQDPLLTLGHEFAHLVEELKLENFDNRLGPPNDTREKNFDEQAKHDLDRFQAQNKSTQAKPRR